MQGHDYLVVALGILITTSGLSCLYLSWKPHIRLNDMFTASGWVTLACAAPVWIELAGLEIGLMLATIVPAMVGLFFITNNVTWRLLPMAMRIRLRLGAPDPGNGDRQYPRADTTSESRTTFPRATQS